MSQIGSPVGSPEHKLSRSDARKTFKGEVDLIVQAIKLIPTYASKIFSLGKNAKCTLTVDGKEHQLGRSEFREFVSHIAKSTKKLTSRAFELTKSRRKVGPRAGFQVPRRYSAELSDFFAGAVVGPVVEGQFEQKMEKGQLKMVPVKGSLREVANSKLNAALWLSQRTVNGAQNPMYGISASGIFTPLFVLHAYYTGMPIQGEATHLSASAAMRASLRATMERTIDKDSDKFIGILGQGSAGSINAVRTQLKAAIANTNLNVNSVVGTDPRPGKDYGKDLNIFNPNHFPYAHFSKLISNSKVDQAIGDIGAATVQLYGQYVQGLNAENAVGFVLDAQQQRVSLALAHKNVELDKVKREQKRLKKEQERVSNVSVVRQL